MWTSQTSRACASPARGSLRPASGRRRGSWGGWAPCSRRSTTWRWSLGQRTTTESDATVEQALADGRILRTHAVRPTWHFVLPADIRWLVELTEPRIRRSMAYYDHQLEIDEPLLMRTYGIVTEALSRAHTLTRNDVGRLLAEAGIVASGQRLGHLLFHAELVCLVCSGPRKGKQQTYALLDERAPGAGSMHRDEGLSELARRFFASRGPATAKDLSVWGTLTLTEVRRAIDSLGHEVERIEEGGRTYYLIGDTPAGDTDAPRAHLLQGYDEYIMGYNETKDVFGYGTLGPLPPGCRPMTHAVIIDGRVAGHWRRNVAPKALTIDLQLYRRLQPKEREAVSDAIERFGAFVGLPAAAGTIDEPES